MELVTGVLDLAEAHPVVAYAVIGVVVVWALAWAVRLSAH